MAAFRASSLSNAAKVVAVESALALAAGGYVAYAQVAGFPPSPWALLASGVLAALLPITLLLIHGTRAVAVHTFRQCVRAKVAIVIMIVLALVLVALSQWGGGDGTLSSRIRVLLSWGAAATGVLLGVGTVLLGAKVVSGDVRDKQIFITATKPLPRWQYVAGRWLGVSLLFVLLLAVAAGGIYGSASYLREEPAELSDLQTMETEIFTARRQLSPEPEDLKKAIDQRLMEMREDGTLQRAIEGFLDKADGDREKALALVVDEVHKQVQTKVKSRPPDPNKPFRWRFLGVHLDQPRLPGRGVVVGWDAGHQVMRVRTDRRLVAHVMRSGPIEVAGSTGRVTGIGNDSFDVTFRPETLQLRRIANLAKGDEVDVVIDPAFQISYRARAADPLDKLDKRIFTTWLAYNPEKNFLQINPRQDAERVRATMAFSANVIPSDGNVLIECVNESPVTIAIDTKDVQLLFRVGSFHWNFLRAVLLMAMQILFLAAVAVLAGTFLSFPVAVLATSVVVAMGALHGFVAESVGYTAKNAAANAVNLVGRVVVAITGVVLPDFSATSPRDWLVDGTYISWSQVGSAAALGLALRGLLIVALACWIFSRRELARVQV